MDCLFCKIAEKKIDAEFVWENDEFAAFKDIHPKAPVHILIIPKKHIESIDHITDEDRAYVGGLYLAARKVAEVAGIAGAYKVLVNVGRKGGQLIDHLHLHIMGGWPEKQGE